MYKKGSTDKNAIRQFQIFFGLVPTGIFDQKLESVVINYQRENNLVADGIIGRATMRCMGILDTDFQGRLHFITGTGLTIFKHYLPKDEYITENLPVFNDTLVLHHTAGWDNPYTTIADWASDQRGEIATEFVIGGQSIKDRDTYDGVVLQAFPEGCRAWHVASTCDSYINKHSVGIECCNFGQLSMTGNTYTGTSVNESQIVTLTEPFKGAVKFHKYSDKQLSSLKKLIYYIATRDNIDIRKGLVEWIHKEGPFKAFDYHQKACEGKIKGLLVHANIVKTKLDMFPQPELVDMLLSL